MGLDDPILSLTKVHTVFERWFFHVVKVEKDTPLHHRYPTQEIDYPYRLCPQSHILRLWPARIGVVLGKWLKDMPMRDWEDSLIGAVQGDIIGSVDELWLFRQYYGFFDAGRSAGDPAQHPVGPGEDLDAGSARDKDHPDAFF